MLCFWPMKNKICFFKIKIWITLLKYFRVQKIMKIEIFGLDYVEKCFSSNFWLFLAVFFLRVQKFLLFNFFIYFLVSLGNDKVSKKIKRL